MLRLTNLQPRGLGPVTLDVATSGCLAVSGPSGSGKTVLLRAIADLDENDGEAETNRMIRSQTSAPDWRSDVAYVPAESGWWADTVGAHIMDTDTCHTLLAELGLDKRCLQWEVARLSTGEKQRLALVRVLLADPAVLLLDEPTSALDAEATEAMECVLLQRMAAGTTLVVVTHDAGQIKRLGARQARLERGQLHLSEDAPV